MPKARNASRWNGGATRTGRALTRDYFRVESREGVRVWLYREGLFASGSKRAGSCMACSHEQFVAFPDERSSGRRRQARLPAPAYAELAVTTNFSFLRGASHPEELVRQAVALGLTGIGIADRNSVAGVVRAYSALEQIERALRTRTARH